MRINKLLVMVSNVEKWDSDDENIIAETTYIGTWEIADTSTEEGKEIEQEFIESGIGADPYHEYLVITTEDGETATYRNSYVDLFELHINR